MATKWPEEVKQAVLADYLEIGPTAAAEKHGVPVGSVKGWAHRAGLSLPNSERARWERETLLRHHELSVEEAEQHQAEWGRWLTESQIRQEQKRAVLKERFLDVALEALARVNDEHVDYKGKDAIEVVYDKPDAASYFNYVKSAATALDKYRLESGESTDRTEVLSGDSPVDREIQRLLAEHERQAQARAEAEAVADAAPARTDPAG